MVSDGEFVSASPSQFSGEWHSSDATTIPYELNIIWSNHKTPKELALEEIKRQKDNKLHITERRKDMFR